MLLEDRSSSEWGQVLYNSNYCPFIFFKLSWWDFSYQIFFIHAIIKKWQIRFPIEF